MSGVGAAAGLGVRRALAAPGRWLPITVSLALAVALFTALSAAGVVAGDHAARRSLGRLGVAGGTVTVTWSYGGGAAVDRSARGAVAAMGGGAVTRGITLVPTDFGRAVIRLAAADPVAPAVRLLSGRLPTGPCRPARCEVLHVAGRVPGPLVADRGIHLVVVGRGLVTAPTAIGFTTTPAGFRPTGSPVRGAPLLLSADPAGVEALAPLDSLARTQSWSAPLPIADLHAWDIDEQVARIARVDARLQRATDSFTVTSPTLALQRASARSRQAPGRLAAAGATAAAALAAFLILTAGALRAGLLGEDARLRRGGATAAQRTALALAETGVPVLAGAVAGVAVGLGAAWARAAAGDVDAGHVLAEAAGGMAVRAVVVGLVGWALTLAAARASVVLGRALASAALIAAIALLAGMLAPRDRASDPLPGSVVPLAAGAAALLVALVLPVLLPRVVRRLPARRPAVRLGLLELARRPGPAAVAAAGLVASLGLTGFAFAYRSTLERSRADQADHRVPLAATVLPGADLRSPLAVRAPQAWSALPGAASAVAVVRRDANVLIGPTREAVSLVGLPAAALVDLPGAGADRAALSRRLTAPPFDRAAAGIRLPATAARVTLPANADGDRTTIALVVRTPGGRTIRVGLGTAGSGSMLSAPLPPATRGGLATGFVVAPPSSLLATSGHNQAEGSGGTQAAGTLRLGALRVGGTELDISSWRPREPLTGSASVIDYHLKGPALVRPDQPSDLAPLPLLADPATARDAAIAKEVDLDVLGVPIRARVVGVLRGFPTVATGQPLVVADGPALSAALDAALPGSGEPRELWLAARPGQQEHLAAAAIAAAREDGLRVQTHAAVRRALDAEPVAREVLGALAAAALLAAVLSLAGVAVAVRRALRDDAAALFDLEAQGLAPAALRQGLRVRGAVIALAGVLGGCLLALGLTALVTGAVRAGATGPPDPPLVTVVPWAAGGLGALLLLAAGVGAAALAAAPALRAPVPRVPASAEAA